MTKRTGQVRSGGPATIETVRRFWEENPLYAGEAGQAAGSAEFFDAHERVTLKEHSGALHPIFLRDVNPGAAIIDVGCGIGFWTVQLARRGASVSACDLTETGCRLTAKRLALNGLGARIVVGNAEALPYRAGAFDHVNCQGVIHHTPDTRGCLHEFHRVLKPGGTLCFSVYYRALLLRWPPLFRFVANLAGRVMTLPGRGRESVFKASDPDNFVRMYDGVKNPVGRSYTRSELRLMIQGAFEVVEELRFSVPRRVLPIEVPDWLHGMLARTFGLMIAFRCRRIDAPQVEARI
jgi:2-polyprenyl-3-methyl-5-hydroxy-6-metoxy-1,4-benzoquinol methylase